MANSKEQHPSQGPAGPGSPGIPGDVATPEAIKEHMEAVGDGMGNAVKAVRDIEAAQAATVQIVQPPDDPDGLAQTAGRNTSIRQITFASPSPYATLAAAFDAVKAKALSFGDREPEVRMEITGNAEQGFTANALLTFTSVYDDPQAALVG